MIEPGTPAQSPVLARSTDGHAGDRAAEPKIDPNRVPVWIAPTPKYEYTPVPVEQSHGPKRTPVIGGEARGAMAKSHPRTIRAPRAPERAVAPAAPRLSSSTRDNDPFFRD